MRWIFSSQPIDRLSALLKLIEQVQDRATALEILESLLRWSERVLTADSVDAVLH